jgi:two-component system alkaline phosphatase synthesis response regulator PhoP
MIPSISGKEVIKRILAIDDGIEITQLIHMLLTANGYAVDVALCGRDGIIQAMKRTPDLILLDYMMPDKDGLQVLREIRQTPGLEDIPVIMLTAIAKNDIIKDALKLNVSDYLLKPFDLKNLLERIEKFI